MPEKGNKGAAMPVPLCKPLKSARRMRRNTYDISINHVTLERWSANVGQGEGVNVP
jgi:hypothetical protein